MNGNRFTQEGLELHKRKVALLEEKVREAGKEAGEQAGDNCDWHDNFGYEEAKRSLELESQRLRSLRAEVHDRIMVEIQDQTETVQIGTTVVVAVAEEDGMQKEYTIGAFGESLPAEGFISYTSPLARGLIGMKSGDSKALQIAGKVLEIEVIEVKPPSYKYRALMAKMMAIPEGGVNP